MNTLMTYAIQNVSDCGNKSEDQVSKLKKKFNFFTNYD